MKTAIITLFLFAISAFGFSQSTPGNFIFTTQSAIDYSYFANGYGDDYNSSTNYHVFFGTNALGNPTNDRILTSFDVGSTTYQPVTLPNGECYTRVLVNRVVNPNVSDLDKQTLFFEKESQSGSNVYFTPSYTNIQEAVNTRIVNRGGDNVFSNEGGQTLNNIERIDLIIDGGVFTPDNTQAGFMINERGGNDEFAVAAITALDGSGNVSSLGSLVDIDIPDWGNTGVSVTTTVFQRGSSDPEMRPNQDLTAQNIHGVFISYSDLGIANNTTIYGIAVFPGDVHSSMDLIGLSNVPLNTTAASNDAGGLDLMGGGGYFASAAVIVTDLQVNLSSNIPIPSDNDIVQITVRVDNNGPLNDNNINVSTQIPSGYSYVGLASGYTGTASESGGTVSWSFPSLNVGNYEELVILVETQATGGRTFTSTVSGTITDISLGNNTDNLELTIDTEQSSLPVNLISFSGKKIEQAVVLRWATQAEINNKEFVVERSQDGKYFAALGKVMGFGNSNTLKNYEYIDSNPLSGISYYRLRQIDFDGGFEISKIISVSNPIESNLNALQNPVSENILLQIGQSDNRVFLFDINGSLLFSDRGKKEYLIPTDFPSGTYFIQIVSGQDVLRRKLIKL